MCAWDRCTVSDCRTVCIGLWCGIISVLLYSDCHALCTAHLSVRHNVIGADYHAVIAVACNTANSSANAQYLHIARISDPR